MTNMEIIALVSAFIALLGVAFSVLYSASKVGRMSGIVEKTLQVQNDMIGELKGGISKLSDELKADIGKLSEVMITMAVQTTRLDSQSTQIATLQREIGDLRRGEGYIFPLSEQFLQTKK